MDSPLEFFVTRPEDGKVLCVLLTIFDLVFIAFAPYDFGKYLVIIIVLVSAISSVATLLFTDGIKREIVKSYPMEAITNGTARWKHLQMILSLILFASNFFSLCLQIEFSRSHIYYLFTAVVTAIVAAAYFLEAIASPRITDNSPDEETIINGEEAV
uniref:DUF3796 domain-containing protein n=1 Tax=Panagrellus redivivus TaxID=6233 RepID=A0A7E4ZPU5_PANRE